MFSWCMALTVLTGRNCACTVNTFTKLKTSEVPSFLGQASLFRPFRPCQWPSYKFNHHPAEPSYSLPLQSMEIQISWLLQKPTDLDLHCLPFSMWICINSLDQGIWLANNQKWTWHLNLFSMTKVKIFWNGFSDHIGPDNILSRSKKKKVTAWCMIKWFSWYVCTKQTVISYA